MISKVLKFLREFDFIWSLPLAFGMFILFPVLGQWVFCKGQDDCDFSMYPPEFFHAGIYAGLMAILFNSLTQMAIYFNFPVLYQYYLDKGFEDLSIKTKVCVFLFVFCFYYCSLLFLWSLLV